ncbi:MAG: hypothetical protein O3C40_37425 [Planctomycetota bacterium]|nr:hypothetical protein [Planctomycetota bacterium]
MSRSWSLNDPNFKGSMLLTKNLSPENMALKCKHAISQLGQRYVDYVVRGSQQLPEA